MPDRKESLCLDAFNSERTKLKHQINILEKLENGRR